MELKDIVCKQRIKMGLTQYRLAKLTGLSKSFISLIESGRYKFTSGETIGKLAKVLNIELEEFYKALASRDFIIRDAPPRSLQDLSLRELQTNIIEVPIVAELHMPGEIFEYAYISRPRPGQVNFVGVRAKRYCLEPEIKDGDILIIDKDAVPEAGHTILCYHNGSQHPRLIKFKRRSDLKDCDIYGVVIGINRRL